MVIDFNGSNCMFINWLNKESRIFLVQKFKGKLFLYFYFFEVAFCWGKSEAHSFRKMIGFMMADAEQELKSSGKFNDQVGEEVAKGKIEVLKEVIAQYELENV